eukprot:3167899-Amphidinium_carterae.1
MAVCPAVQSDGSYYLVSDAEPVPLAAFVSMLEAAVPKQPSRAPIARGTRATRVQPDDAEARPYLQNATCPKDAQPNRSKRKAPSASTQEHPEEVEEEGECSQATKGDDETLGAEVRELFTELNEKQKEIKHAHQSSNKDFVIAIIGETRKMQVTGTAVAGVRASLRRGSAVEAWAQEYGMQLAKRFEFSAYGEQWAMRLARSWLHRMEFLYHLHVHTDDPDRAYTDESLRTYKPSLDLTACLAELKGTGYKRAQEIMQLAPRVVEKFGRKRAVIENWCKKPKRNTAKNIFMQMFLY